MKLAPVVHFTGQTAYSSALPYHPPERYPELGFLGEATDPGNRVYAGVREMLRALGYDAARYGGPDWSPLSDLVAPGGSVVLKPNYVRHYSEKPGGSQVRDGGEQPVAAAQCESLMGKIEGLYRQAAVDEGVAANLQTEFVQDLATMVLHDCRTNPEALVPCIQGAEDVRALEAACVLALDDEGTVEGRRFGGGR